MRKLAVILFHASGALTIALGVVHLAATSHIAGLVSAMRFDKGYKLAVAATELNHVMVGFLLLAVGYTTYHAGSEPHARFQRRLLRVNALVMLTAPLSVWFLMRGARISPRRSSSSA